MDFPSTQPSPSVPSSPGESFSEDHSHKRKMLLLLFFSVFLLVVIGGGLWWGFHRYHTSPVPMPTSSAEVLLENTGPTVDPLPNDKDRDGISNEEEARLGTSDVEFDTDGDGLTDREELEVWHTDPLLEDTDGDGYLDGFEVLKGYSPTEPSAA